MQTNQESKKDTLSFNAPLPESKLLKINRRYDVPLEELFHAFTTSEGLKKWWWPSAYHSDHVELAFKKGGKYFINIKGSAHGEGGMCGEFKEIVQNKRIVMTDHFADSSGKAISAEEAGIPGLWPETVIITFDFYPIEKYSSRFTLSQQGIPKEMQKDCLEGWNESFEKLERYLDN